MRNIEIEYILKNEEGKEVARFSDIEDAKQYDRMLTAAEEIFSLFGNIKELDSVKEAVKDDIAFQIARNSDAVMEILAGIRGRKGKSANKSPKKNVASAELAVPALVETEIEAESEAVTEIGAARESDEAVAVTAEKSDEKDQVTDKASAAKAAKISAVKMRRAS